MNVRVNMRIMFRTNCDANMHGPRLLDVLRLLRAPVHDSGRRLLVRHQYHALDGCVVDHHVEHHARGSMRTSIRPISEHD